MHRRTSSLLAALSIVIFTAGPVDAASWKKDLIKKVSATYKPTSISLWDGSLKAGYDVLVLAQPGVFAWAARDSHASYPRTAVTDGKLTQPRGADTMSGAREFRKGEKVVIYDLGVDSKDDGDQLILLLLSVASTERQEGGNTVSTRYKGGLVFNFPRGYLASTDFADVKKAINTVLVSETEFKAMDVPATVRLGMDTAEVENSLGKPQKVLDLGSKKIYVYPDLKITFMEGRVADVQ